MIGRTRLRALARTDPDRGEPPDARTTHRLGHRRGRRGRDRAQDVARSRERPEGAHRIAVVDGNRRKRALAHDHGMHELHREVARVLGPFGREAPHGGAGSEPAGEGQCGAREVGTRLGPEAACHRRVVGHRALVNVSASTVDCRGTVPPNAPRAVTEYRDAKPEGARGGCFPACEASRPARRASASRVTQVRAAVLEAFVDTAGDAMFSIDTAGRVAIWNHAAARLFGYDAADIVGTEWAVLFPEHRRHGLKVVFDAVAAGDRVDHYETEIDRREGMAVPVMLSLCGVFDRGSYLGSVAVVRDITEQRLAQAMLAEAEARLREGEALAHVGRWHWDVATDAVQWSDEFHRIHGVDPLDFDGTFDAHLACIHEADRRPRARRGRELDRDRSRHARGVPDRAPRR